MTATRRPRLYQPPVGVPAWHTIPDAAKALGCDESTIRRACRRAGVKRVHGPATAGMVELSGGGRIGYLPYME